MFPTLSSCARRIFAVWQHLPLKTKGFVLAAIPLLAILVSASIAYLGNRQRERAETDVARHFEVVTDLEELSTLVVNAETGTRGYLLTRRVEFLQPYRHVSGLLPGKIAALRAVVQLEPGERPRLEKSQRVHRIETLVQAQMQALTKMQRLGSSAQENPTDLYRQLEQSKGLMDKLRGELRSMRTQEQSLLTERLAEIAWVWHRDYLAIGITLVLSLMGRFLAVYLFNTGVVQRVKNIQENVNCLKEGRPIAFEASDKPDALGELEREVAATHQLLISATGLASGEEKRSGNIARHDTGLIG